MTKYNAFQIRAHTSFFSAKDHFNLYSLLYIQDYCAENYLQAFLHRQKIYNTIELWNNDTMKCASLCLIGVVDIHLRCTLDSWLITYSSSILSWILRT